MGSVRGQGHLADPVTGGDVSGGQRGQGHPGACLGRRVDAQQEEALGGEGRHDGGLRALRAALVLAAVGASLAVAGNLRHQPVTAGPQAGVNGVPAYYVALITAKPQSDVANDLGSSSSLAYSAAELRSTQTGAVLARITPPKPYVSFTGARYSAPTAASAPLSALASMAGSSQRRAAEPAGSSGSM